MVDVNFEDGPTPTQASTSQRDGFFKWLSGGNVSPFKPKECVECVDKMSDFALENNISDRGYWEITHSDDFKSNYKKLLTAIQIHLPDENEYLEFMDTCGELYSIYLDEIGFEDKQTDDIAYEENIAKDDMDTDYQSVADEFIDSKAFIAWLTTQRTEDGSLFLVEDGLEYVEVLRSAPLLLNLWLSPEERNVFDCITLDDFELLWDIFREDPRFSLVNQTTLRKFSEGMVNLWRYLQYSSIQIKHVPLPESHPIPQSPSTPMTQPLLGSIAASHEAQVNKPFYIEEPEFNQGSQVEPAENSEPTGTTVRVDFAMPEKCAGTQLVSCTINGHTITPSKLRWTTLLVAVAEWFIASDHPNLASLGSLALGGSRMFFMNEKDQIGTSSLLSNGKWLYTSYSPQVVIKIIANLCRHCGVDLDEVIINYTPKDITTGNRKQSFCEFPNVTEVDFSTGFTSDTDIDYDLITQVLSNHFSLGFLVNSPIALARFRQFASEQYAYEISLNDLELTTAIEACGISFSNKVFVVSEQAKERIVELADEYFATGALGIFYDEFFAKNEQWLFESRIIEEDMLKEMLPRLFPKLLFNGNYFGHTDIAILALLESEILRVWGEQPLITYEQLSERLHYIPTSRIKTALSQVSVFIRNGANTYTHLDKIDITDEEHEAIREAALFASDSQGYVSIPCLPTGEIEERNYELSKTAIHNAVFCICLSDIFDRKGKVAIKKGDTLDALAITRDHCRCLDRCTLDDLLNFERELTGEVHRWIPIQAGYESMIRIDEEYFVAENLVDFDVSAIDEAISQFVGGDYMPLKSISTFGIFPDCGQRWNLFLLESYCRRFSNRFRFDTPSVNSRNAGAIIRKSCGMSYTEVMTDAVAKSDTLLDETHVNRFLFESGYIGKSTSAKAREVMESAKTLRGG